MARLLLFAAAREAARCREVQLPGDSVGEILHLAVERFGASFGRVLASSMVLADEVTVEKESAWETGVTETTEVAILPPVSGGAGMEDSEPAVNRLRVAVLTVSDRSATGQRRDESGPAVEVLATQAGWDVVCRELVADDQARIQDQLRAWTEAGIAELILTTGGTGLGPRDVTPEATRNVIDREIPGIPEAMRAAGMAVTPYAALSRQVAGQRGRTMIVNLPGSPKAARECLEAVVPVLAHAVEVIRGPVTVPSP